IVEQYAAMGASALSNAPFLVAHAVNRMAIAYPYYYSIFTERGPVCGTLLEFYLPGEKPCHPSYLIYSTIYGADGYENRGTAPVATHVNSYALAGWGGAILGLVFMTILLGLFAAIPVHTSIMSRTWAVMGVVVGYHLSQV